MAQSSSAAREPSMEEILASIRRIIEDSDVSRHPAPAFPARGDVAKFRTPPHVQSLTPKVEEKPDPKPAVFSEEPALRGPLLEPVAEVDTPDDVSDAEDEDESGFFALNAQNDDHRSEISSPVAEVEDEPSVETPVMAAAEPAVAETVNAPVAEPVTETKSADLKTSASAHILSQGTQHKVAAAFQDLNHAVHSEPRRSFDEIASDLLRPMLQNWLDTNLPPLVERLVREEIERVVRGES